MWSSPSASILTGRHDSYPKRPARLARGKLRLDIPFNAALDLLRGNDGGVFAPQEAISSERFGRRGVNWSLDQLDLDDLDSLKLDNILDAESPLSPKRSSEGLKKKLERDDPRVLKKSTSKRALDIPDVTAEEVENLKSPSGKPTVASEVMEALRLAVGNKEDAEGNGLSRSILGAEAEGRRRSATGAMRHGSRHSSKRGSAESSQNAVLMEEQIHGRDSVTSMSSALSDDTGGSSRSKRPGRQPSRKKHAACITLSAPRMPARRLMPRSAGRNGEHRSEAWLARDTGLPLPVLQQSLAFFKKYVPEYDGTNLFDVKFDMKNFANVLCEMAGVGSVEQLDRVFVSEAFRQADFDCSGGIDCMEFVLWFSAFGFAPYFCVTKEDLPQRDLARKLGVDYIELERYKQAFDKYDEDGSGAIDMDEFECLLSDLLKVPAGHHLSAERIMVLWRDADREGEGELDLEAFCGFFKRHFEDAENSISDYYRSIRRIPTAKMML